MFLGLLSAQLRPAVCLAFLQSAVATAQTPVDVDVDLSHTTHRVDTGRFFGTVQWPDTPAKKAIFLPRLKKYGIRCIRNDLRLESLLSPDRCVSLAKFEAKVEDPRWVDSWNWKVTDWVKDARKEGFRTQAIYCYFPKFLTANGSLPRKGDEASWRAWGKVCGIATERLSKWIDYAEIFNEAHFFTKPENTGYTRSVDADPDIYAYAQPEIRRAFRGPIGGTATWVDVWTGSALETLPYDPRITRRAIDYASIHVYDTKLPMFLSRLDEAQAVFAGTSKRTPASYDRRLSGLPLWLTEWDFYWEDKQVGLDWYGYVLTELLKRGIDNDIYNYEETFSPKNPELQKPWLLLVRCGLNERAQKLSVHPASGTNETLNVSAATLPDRSVVLLAANTGDLAAPISWRLPWKPRTARMWIAEGDGEEIPPPTDLRRVPAEPTTLPVTVPPHSFVAVRVRR